MPWTYFTDDRNRPWKINQLGLWILVRQHVYNRALLRRSHVARATHVFGPDAVSVETDFRGVAADRDRESLPLYGWLEGESSHDGAQTLERLVQMRWETEHTVTELRRMQRSASHEMFQNIDRSVHRGEVGVAVASHVRDLSATILVVGSAFLTGGASVAVLGGGSALRGWARYQDSGNVGSAIITATGTFVVGVIPLTGGKLTAGASVTARVGGEVVHYGERATLVVVGASLDAQFQACNALIEGRSGREALRAAAARFGVDVLSGGLSTGLDHWALPVVVRLIPDTAVAAGGDALVDRVSAEQPPPRPGAARSMPAPTNPPVCDANAVLSSGDCSAQDWVRQIVLQAA